MLNVFIWTFIGALIFILGGWLKKNATRRLQRKKNPRNPNHSPSRSLDLNSLQHSTSRSHDHAEPVDSRLPTASHEYRPYCTPRILIQDTMAKNTNPTSQSRTPKLADGLERYFPMLHFLLQKKQSIQQGG